jgi:NTP pyrophosphatase (non-canonical NTP hydrolase)
MVRAIGDVMRERDHQDAKWGEQQHDPVYWVGILAEELGEVAKEAIEIVPMSARGIRPRDESLARLRAELVQLAAVAVAAIEYLDRLPPQEDWTEVGEA